MDMDTLSSLSTRDIPWQQFVSDSRYCSGVDRLRLAAFAYARSLTDAWPVDPTSPPRTLSFVDVWWWVPAQMVAVRASVSTQMRSPVESRHPVHGLVRVGADVAQTVWSWEPNDESFMEGFWARMQISAPPRRVWWDVQGPILWTGSTEEGEVECNLDPMYRSGEGGVLATMVTRDLWPTWERPRIHLSGYPDVVVPDDVRTITAQWPASRTATHPYHVLYPPLTLRDLMAWNGRS